MGKSRQKKRDRKLTAYPGRVYRFFEKREWAQALIDGEVWLGTLQGYRRDENKQRGDKFEGMRFYNSGHITDDHPGFALVADRSGILVQGPASSGNIISNNTTTHIVADAFVLCTTLSSEPREMEKEFGSFCVEMRAPDEFWQHVARALTKEFGNCRPSIGPVTYGNVSYTGLEPVPGIPGLLKQRRYAYQKEYRFLYEISAQQPLEPFSLPVPETKGLCRLIKC